MSNLPLTQHQMAHLLLCRWLRRWLDPTIPSPSRWRVSLGQFRLPRHCQRTRLVNRRHTPNHKRSKLLRLLLLPLRHWRKPTIPLHRQKQRYSHHRRRTPPRLPHRSLGTQWPNARKRRSIRPLQQQPHIPLLLRLFLLGSFVFTRITRIRRR